MYYSISAHDHWSAYHFDDKNCQNNISLSQMWLYRAILSPIDNIRLKNFNFFLDLFVLWIIFIFDVATHALTSSGVLNCCCFFSVFTSQLVKHWKGLNKFMNDIYGNNNVLRHIQHFASFMSGSVTDTYCLYHVRPSMTGPLACTDCNRLTDHNTDTD
jgi:hypothetical protein